MPEPESIRARNRSVHIYVDWSESRAMSNPNERKTKPTTRSRAGEEPSRGVDRPTLIRLSQDRYLGDWNAFIGDYSAHVRTEVLRRKVDPSLALPRGNRQFTPLMSLKELPNLWIDSAGTRWDLTRTRAPLDIPYVMPGTIGLWPLVEADEMRGSGYFGIDRERFRTYEAAGLSLRPACLMSGSEFEFVAEGNYEPSLTEELLHGVFPAFRVYKGVFGMFYTEGGWEAKAVPIALGSSNARATEIDADRVRLAIGLGLSGLALKDGTLGSAAVSVTGGKEQGFEITLDATATVPSMKEAHRMKRLSIRWSASDGDPYDFTRTYLSEHEFGPESEDWWY